MPTQLISCGQPVSILQNVVYALPVKAVVLISDAAVDVGQSLTGPWTAYTGGSVSAGSFVRCA